MEDGKSETPETSPLQSGVMPISELEYSVAIENLIEARKQLRPDGNPCILCGDNDHQAWECRMNILVQAKKGKAKEDEWRCFHCGEIFNDSEDARKHFGRTTSAMPRCVLQKCQCFDCSASSDECDRFKA